MKMSEWFDLPMDVSNEDREPLLADKNYYISSFITMEKVDEISMKELSLI
jgi:hypothetical protein